jgi:hypothetical protein
MYAYLCPTYPGSPRPLTPINCNVRRHQNDAAASVSRSEGRVAASLSDRCNPIGVMLRLELARILILRRFS